MMHRLWGQTAPDGLLSPKLMEINKTLIGNANCRKENLHCSENLHIRPG